MAKNYSVAEARSKLPGIIQEVERGQPVEITRRGKPVAVVLSVQEYRSLAAPKVSFMEAYEAWRASVGHDAPDIEPGYFDALRDRSPGRDVKL